MKRLIDMMIVLPAAAFALPVLVDSALKGALLMGVVLLATVLLFVGIGSKMDTLRVRLFLLVAASTLLFGVIATAAVLPKEI